MEPTSKESTKRKRPRKPRPGINYNLLGHNRAAESKQRRQEALSRFMAEKNWTRERVAKYCRCSPSYFNGIISRGGASYVAAQRLSAALGLPEFDFLF